MALIKGFFQLSVVVINEDNAEIILLGEMIKVKSIKYDSLSDTWEVESFDKEKTNDR